jgi:tetratricopeptide (TPR) repeat protein
MTGQLMLNFGFSADRAVAELRTALEIFRSIGERWGIGFSLSQLGDLAAAAGDFGQAVIWQREAIGLIREVGIREDVPQVQVKLAAQLWMAGDRAEARRMIKEARACAEEIGLAEVMGSVEYASATLARLEGDLDRAREYAERAMRQTPPSTFAPQFAAAAESARGMVEAAAGDLPLARRRHTEAIELAVSSNDQPVMAIVLLGVADLVLREGDPRRSAVLLGAADGIRGSADRSQPDVDRLTAQARAALGDAGFEAAYAEGLRLRVEDLHAAAEGPDRQRGEHDQEAGRPEQ